jgi:hypothetical protein
MLQVTSMAANRNLLRRGAQKMQNGTLGEQTGEDDDMGDISVRVGDEVHYHTEAATQSPTAGSTTSDGGAQSVPEVTPAASPVSAGMSTAAKVLTTMAAATLGPAAAVGVAALAGAFDKAEPPTVTPASQQEFVDTDTVPFVIVERREDMDRSQ